MLRPPRPTAPTASPPTSATRSGRTRRCYIDMSICINCDTCIRHCPPQFGAIFNHGIDVIIIPELCSGCGKCLDPLPGRLHRRRPGLDAASPADWWDEPGRKDDPYWSARTCSGRNRRPEGARGPFPRLAPSMAEPHHPRRRRPRRPLARLRLTDDELDRFTAQLGAMLEHAADIEALDLDDVAADRPPAPARATCCAPTSSARPSTATRCSPPAPAAEDGRFRVPPHPGRGAVTAPQSELGGRPCAVRRRGRPGRRHRRGAPRRHRRARGRDPRLQPRAGRRGPGRPPTRSTPRWPPARTPARWPACRSR